MRKISKPNVAKIAGLHNRIVFVAKQYNALILDLDSQIKELIDVFNAQHSEQIEELQTAYNASAAELKSLVLDQVNLMEAYMGDRSDSWHDSDSGSDYLFWSELWQEFGEFLERAEYEEFDIQVQLKNLEIEGLPSFNVTLK